MTATATDVDWRIHAVCAGEDPNIWYDHATNVEAVRFAKAICESCPVQRECLSAAMRAEGSANALGRYGIWGGLTPQERARQARRASIEDPDDPRHGTSTGFAAHRASGVPACRACMDARNAHWRTMHTAPAPIDDPDDPRHGTTAGWHAHRRTGRAACEPCKKAYREAGSVARKERADERHREAAARISRPDDARHGTHAGWQAERKYGVPHCDPCIEARKEHRRDVSRRSREKRRALINDPTTPATEAYPAGTHTSPTASPPATTANAHAANTSEHSEKGPAHHEPEPNS